MSWASPFIGLPCVDFDQNNNAFSTGCSFPHVLKVVALLGKLIPTTSPVQ